MTKVKNINKDLFYGVLTVLFVAVFLNYLMPIDFIYKPNLLLISAVMLGILIDSFGLLVVFSTIQGIITKNSPFIYYELSFIFLASLLSYFIYKKFFFKNEILCISILVVIFTTIFWLFFGNIIASGKIFVMELLYNIILSIIIFELFSWIRKKFS